MVMAQVIPELEEELRALDHELEEGDITKKGYDKRRTQILSRYLAPAPSAPTEEPRRVLRVHQADGGTGSISSRDDFRADSLSRLEGARRESTSSRNGTMTRQSMSYDVSPSQPPSHASRFIQQQVGGMGRQNSMPSMEERRSTMTGNTLTVNSGSGDNSRAQSLMHQDFAFNPEQQGMYNPGPETRASTLLDSQGYFSDFAGQQREEQQENYGGHMHRYSDSGVASPTAQVPPPFLGAG